MMVLVVGGFALAGLFGLVAMMAHADAVEVLEAEDREIHELLVRLEVEGRQLLAAERKESQG